MSEYRISYNIDPYDIMDSLSDSEEVDFVFDCYDYLDSLHKKAFIKMLGADAVFGLRGREDVVIKELESRGYIITKEK